MADRDLVRFYFDTISLNDQLMQWYRAFFLASEGIISAVAFASSISLELRSALAVVGIVLSLVGTWACVQRGRIVDRQKKKITDELYDKDGEPKKLVGDLAECFQIYNPVKAKAEKGSWSEAFLSISSPDLGSIPLTGGKSIGLGR